MIVTLITCVQISCFLVPRISSQYNYQQGPYNQHPYPQNYQQVHYSQQYNENPPQGFYQHQGRNQNSLPYENVPIYPQSRYRVNHRHRKSSSRRSRHRDASSSDDTASESESYDSYGECKCFCSECETPESLPCCEPVCDSCSFQPQRNQEVVIFPYPYPLIITGLEPKKIAIDPKPTNLTNLDKTKPDNVEETQTTIERAEFITDSIETTTKTTNTTAANTDTNPSETTNNTKILPSDIETKTIIEEETIPKKNIETKTKSEEETIPKKNIETKTKSKEETIPKKNITRLKKKAFRQFDEDHYYDYFGSNNPHASFKKDINGFSTGRTKKRLLPRYGIVPIPDELALKLMTQMKRMNAIPTRKQHPLLVYNNNH